MGDRLIEERERVAHRTLGGAHDGAQGLVLGLDLLGGADLGEVCVQHRRLDPAQVEPLAARQDRHRDLADLRGGEHELGVGGGSSSVFRKALNAFSESMWTSSTM